MMDTPAQVRTPLQRRAACYGFLAWLFNEQPDEDFVACLGADDLQESLRSLASGSVPDSRMISGLQVMRSSLVGDGYRAVDEICASLAVERTKLLRGIARDYGPPPPYESLYRDAQGETSVLVEIAEFYRIARAELPTGRADRIDYLGLELDLMRLLCEQEDRYRIQADAEASAGCVALQSRFLHEHILAWVPGYCQSLAQATDGFYQGVAQLLLGFLEQEASIEVERPSENHALPSIHPPVAGGEAR